MRALLLSMAVAVSAPLLAADKKPSAWETCKTSGKSDQECRQHMDPALRKSLENQDAILKKNKQDADAMSKRLDDQDAKLRGKK